MTTQAGIIKMLREHKKDLRRTFGVKSLALFGSFARGDQRESSDVDILVNVDPSIGLEFVSLAEALERMLRRRVDLVSTRSVKPSRLRLIRQDAIRV